MSHNFAMFSLQKKTTQNKNNIINKQMEIGCEHLSINPLSPNIQHIQILHTDIHTIP